MDNQNYNGQPPVNGQPPQNNQMPPYYGQPQPPQPVKPGGKSIAGLVLGVLSVLLFFVGFATFWSWLIGLVMSIVGLILSVVGYKQDGKNGVAIAGLVLSIIALVLNVILFVACGLCAVLLVSSAAAVA